VADVEIRRAASNAELDAAIALRHEVFCREQGVPPQDELDGRDDDGLHLVAVEDGEVLATCRLVWVGSTVQFSRLAVEHGYRGRGVGSKLLAMAEDEARSTRARRMVLHAQTHAIDLYAHHGWRTRGPRFVEAGIEHVAMEKPLA
jgi:predicted GNAT family N-acyltransferase